MSRKIYIIIDLEILFYYISSKRFNIRYWLLSAIMEAEKSPAVPSAEIQDVVCSPRSWRTDCGWCRSRSKSEGLKTRRADCRKLMSQLNSVRQTANPTFLLHLFVLFKP